MSMSTLHQSQKANILYVDDEDSIRALAKRFLERMGYGVVTAHDGEAAVRIYSNNPDGYDLVILDSTMPKMSGSETLAHLLEVHPGVKVIISSGLSSDELKKKFLQHPISGFLQKPFDLSRLTAVIRKAIDT